MKLSDPRDLVLIQTAVQTLDSVVALQAPEYGYDRKAHTERVGDIEAGVRTLRRSRRHSPKPTLPSARDVAQLGELSGRKFARWREQMAKTLQSYIDAINAPPRTAPDEVRKAIRAIAQDSKPLIRDADEAWRAFHAGGYKAALVMAGATIEGVLQAGVEQLGKRTASVYRELYPARKAPGSPDDYRFEEALAVLRQMGALTSAISHVARGMKELRNFVHPAVQKRERSRITDTQALLALQAVAAICEELSERLQSD